MHLAKKLEDRRRESAALNNLGLIHGHRGDRDRALQYLEQALKLATDIDCKPVAIHAENDMVAVVYYERGDYGKAIEHLDRAFAAAIEFGYQQFAGVIMANIGELYVRQGDNLRALGCCERALQIATRLGDRMGVLDSVARIGVICAAEGRHHAAHDLFDRAIAVSRSVNDRWFLCASLSNKAELYAAQGVPDRAATLAQKAVELGSDAGNREYELKSRLLLARLEVILGRTTSAQAIVRLNELLTGCATDSERAAVYYALWLLDNDRDDSRRAASVLYSKLYDTAPNVEYRQRYESLTGDPLPEPRILSSLTQSGEVVRVDLDALVKEAELASGEALVEAG
jgi:tetratricopeptide (TPR) repeat protein